MKKILLIVLVIAAVGGYFYYKNLTESPKYSLNLAKEAYEDHNMTEFEKYVNVETMVGGLVDNITQQRSLIGSLIPGTGIAKGLINLAKPQLAKVAKKEVQKMVETGSVDPAEMSGTGKKPLVSIAGIMNKIVSPESEFKGISYEKVEGSTALVGLEVTQPKYDTTMVVEVKMVNKGDYWQATELTNIGELIKNAARLEKKRLLEGVE